MDKALAYLNRRDLLHDLQEALRRTKEASANGVPARSVKTVVRQDGGRRRLTFRLTDTQLAELVAAFEAGTTRMELAERYGIGRSSVAKVLRTWREAQAEEGVA